MSVILGAKTFQNHPQQFLFHNIRFLWSLSFYVASQFFLAILPKVLLHLGFAHQLESLKFRLKLPVSSWTSKFEKDLLYLCSDI